MKFLATIFSIFIFISCQHEKQHIFGNKNYSITYASNLNLDKSGKDNTEFILNPKKPKRDRKYIENINMVTRDFGNLSLAKAAQQLKDEIDLVAVITDFNEFERNALNGYRLEFKVIFDEGMRKYIQDYYKKGNQVYILTLASQEDVYSEIYPEMNGVLESFQLK
ncbi:hypothetical protein [Mesonia aestuariivivens]|uniref:DUF4252 domain-containing protein n=1 Tax=Mesonia aestuariivivens TaxID=2796128 RepID=A0ABS6W190_9FLAO|nr:hypothetical protein [Mesonia aestuariivivens]MBW2960884.1 hypothetical protein [Mesonia aestuariivivens]